MSDQQLTVGHAKVETWGTAQMNPPDDGLELVLAADHLAECGKLRAQITDLRADNEKLRAALQGLLASVQRPSEKCVGCGAEPYEAHNTGCPVTKALAAIWTPTTGAEKMIDKMAGSPMTTDTEIIAELRRELQRMKEYAMHKDFCGVNDTSVPRICTCGLDALLAEIGGKK